MNIHIPTGAAGQYDENQRIEKTPRQAFDKTQREQMTEAAINRYGIRPDDANEMRDRDRGHALDQAEHVEQAKGLREKAAAATGGDRHEFEIEAKKAEAQADLERHQYDAARSNTLATREEARGGLSNNTEAYHDALEAREAAVGRAREAQVELQVRAAQLAEMRDVKDDPDRDQKMEQIASDEHAEKLRQDIDETVPAASLSLGEDEKVVAPVKAREAAEVERHEETPEDQRERYVAQVRAEESAKYDEEFPGKRGQQAKEERVEGRVEERLQREDHIAKVRAEESAKYDAEFPGKRGQQSKEQRVEGRVEERLQREAAPGKPTEPKPGEAEKPAAAKPQQGEQKPQGEKPGASESFDDQLQRFKAMTPPEKRGLSLNSTADLRAELAQHQGKDQAKNASEGKSQPTGGLRTQHQDAIKKQAEEEKKGKHP